MYVMMFCVVQCESVQSIGACAGEGVERTVVILARKSLVHVPFPRERMLRSYSRNCFQRYSRSAKGTYRNTKRWKGEYSKLTFGRK